MTRRWPSIWSICITVCKWDNQVILFPVWFFCRCKLGKKWVKILFTLYKRLANKNWIVDQKLPTNIVYCSSRRYGFWSIGTFQYQLMINKCIGVFFHTSHQLLPRNIHIFCMKMVLISNYKAWRKIGDSCDSLWSYVVLIKIEALFYMFIYGYPGVW